MDSQGMATAPKEVTTDPKEKRIRLMRFWLFGTVLIVFAAVTAYMYFWFLGDIVKALTFGLVVGGIVAIAAVLIFLGYRAWLKRRP